MYVRIALTVCMLFMLTGCQTASESIIKKKHSGLYFGNTSTVQPSSHTINRTKTGVIVYKENKVYNSTNTTGILNIEMTKTSNINFGPGSITFGPKEVNPR